MQRSSRPFALWRRPSSRARGYLHSPLEPVLVNMVPCGEGGKRLPWRRAWPRESRRSADFPPSGGRAASETVGPGAPTKAAGMGQSRQGRETPHSAPCRTRCFVLFPDARGRGGGSLGSARSV